MHMGYGGNVVHVLAVFMMIGSPHQNGEHLLIRVKCNFHRFNYFALLYQ